MLFIFSNIHKLKNTKYVYISNDYFYFPLSRDTPCIDDINTSLHTSMSQLSDAENRMYEYCGEELSANDDDSIPVSFTNINGIPKSG